MSSPFVTSTVFILFICLLFTPYLQFVLPPCVVPCLFIPLSSPFASPQDVGYHFVAAVFYLSASVDLAYITILHGLAVQSVGIVSPLADELLKNYRLNISAVVCQIHTYIHIHAIGNFI